MSAAKKPGVLWTAKMGLAALVSLAGLAGFVFVMLKGVLASDNLAGHSAFYTAGWSLFFFLLLGLPCLAAFILGALPWIFWLWGRRKNPEG